jgi:PncC family amidohydrolase
MELAQKVGRLLLQKRKRLAVAESCTGGLLMHQLTNVPGSSAYFFGGVVAYTEKVKSKFLGVQEEVLRDFGAVSIECAESMAASVCSMFDADIGLALTGVAGPSTSEGKPVGLVYVSIYIDRKNHTKSFLLQGNREKIKEEATKEALRFLFQLLS